MLRLRRHAVRTLRALATAAALLAAVPATSLAQTTHAEPPASTPSFGHGRFRFFVDPPVGGASIDVTGRPLAPRTDWLALACDAVGCALRDAVLDAVAEDPMSCGSDEGRQRLVWTIADGLSTQRVVLVIGVDAASAGLRAGPVATAYAGVGPLPRRPDGDGTEVPIVGVSGVPGGDVSGRPDDAVTQPPACRLRDAPRRARCAASTGAVGDPPCDARHRGSDVPVRSADAAGPLILRTVVAQSAATDDRDAPPLFSRQIELVQGDRRQVLGALGLPTDAGAVGAPPEGFLRWAGDLDRDGRPDLVLAMNADATVFMLLLSSLATADEFVGEAGVFVRPGAP